jgi:hypothetical protein
MDENAIKQDYLPPDRTEGGLPHRKHERLQLGGGHLYDRSSV